MIKANSRFEHQTVADFTEAFENSEQGTFKHDGTFLLISVKQGTGHCYVNNRFVKLEPGITLLLSPDAELSQLNTRYIQGNVISFEKDFLSKVDINKDYLLKIMDKSINHICFDLSKDEVTNNYLQTDIHMFSWQYRLCNNSIIKIHLLRNILSGILLILVKSLAFSSMSKAI
jgi:AraC family transcriptional regulator, transcriptional activator of pobA